MRSLKWATVVVAAVSGRMTILPQAPAIGASAPRKVMVSRSGPGSSELQGNIARNQVRELDDPNTGKRWLLLRDSANPAGPGRWVRGPDSAGVRVPGLVPGALVPVIRSGDRLIVEQDSALIHARLEAMALGSAAPGAAVNVRLRIGGRVFRAVALGPGRATLEPEAGVEP
jgi:hypothetical protein